ncbi:hypothetical protein V1264_001467 [Littorina saxatilis]|uniref:Neuronal acetylcholine receptor subunit alpha-7-like n=2 Tax=Littorina saxatilis TaxID=31220 RepID=A0AAN9C2E9_9CAEN
MPGLTEYRVVVASTGDMSYNFPTVISVLCSIDVTYFPFDTQKCALQFGSWAHHGFEINLTNRSAAGDIGSFVVNSEFDITSMPLERHVITYGCCPEPYPDVTFYVNLKRKPMFYVLNLLFPCIIITSMSVLGFLLPPESGEKISLEITVLLSLAVFMLVVSETLPATSETFPWIGVYFACAMILVSVSTVLTVMVLNVHHKNYRPVPRWIKVLILRYAARVVFFTDTGTCRRIQVQQTNSDFTHQNGLSGKHSQDKAGLPQLNGSSRPMSALGEETPVPGNTNLGPLVQVLQEQLRLLNKAEERKKSKERHEIQDNEWRNVAIVLDRLFLMLFLLFFTITSLVVLVPLAERD